MATATALMPSPDHRSALPASYSQTPVSPIPYAVAFKALAMQRQNGAADGLAPPSPYPAAVDPSPVESNTSTSTDATDIEDAAHDPHVEAPRSPDIEVLSPCSPANHPPSVRLDTETASKTVPLADEGPQSVIHAPKGFKTFGSNLTTHHESATSPEGVSNVDARLSSPPPPRTKASSSPSLSEDTLTSVSSESSRYHDSLQDASKDTAPIDTSLPISRHAAGSTPRASTAEEAEAEWRRKRARRSRSLSDTSEVEPAEEAQAAEGVELPSIGSALRNINAQEQEIASLRTTLSECWNLCTSLAVLSAPHRQRMFGYLGSSDVSEHAWDSCWRLCQNLYESRDEDHASQMRPTLELCREFCQALFDARYRGDEVTDSILRVSFELNNHLYNTHDRNLPDAFSERTLDFYLTMCHRLMKQRTSLPEEADQLLRAGWTLAELLINLREWKKDARTLGDTELLSQAVQACWDLCDLFRESWSQTRPDRGTPRAHQKSFPPGTMSLYSGTGSNYAGSRASTSRPPSSLSLIEQILPSTQDRRLRNLPVPETPTTIFDDRDDPSSPVEPSMPNILVLGPQSSTSARNSSRWPSSASQSGHSEVSKTTASSRTAQAQKMRNTETSQGQKSRHVESSQGSPKSVDSGSESGSNPELDVVRIKALLLKAAHNSGFSSDLEDPAALCAYVKDLPTTSFGMSPWQLTLFESYRKLVTHDAMLKDNSVLPVGRKFSAQEIAQAVIRIQQWEVYAWISNLYTWVLGFEPKEASTSRVIVQV